MNTKIERVDDQTVKETHTSDQEFVYSKKDLLQQKQNCLDMITSIDAKLALLK